MRYRIWHLLVAMVFVALWLPLSRWLLALEAIDRPSKPQTGTEFVGFYLGSTVLVGLPFSLDSPETKETEGKQFAFRSRIVA